MNQRITPRAEGARREITVPYLSFREIRALAATFVKETDVPVFLEPVRQILVRRAKAIVATAHGYEQNSETITGRRREDALKDREQERRQLRLKHEAVKEELEEVEKSLALLPRGLTPWGKGLLVLFLLACAVGAIAAVAFVLTPSVQDFVLSENQAETLRLPIAPVGPSVMLSIALATGLIAGGTVLVLTTEGRLHPWIKVGLLGADLLFSLAFAGIRISDEKASHTLSLSMGAFEVCVLLVHTLLLLGVCPYFVRRADQRDAWKTQRNVVRAAQQRLNRTEEELVQALEAERAQALVLQEAEESAETLDRIRNLAEAESDAAYVQALLALKAADGPQPSVDLILEEGEST